MAAAIWAKIEVTLAVPVPVIATPALVMGVPWAESTNRLYTSCGELALTLLVRLPVPLPAKVMVAGTPEAQVALIPPLALGVVPGAIDVPNKSTPVLETVVHPATILPLATRLVLSVDAVLAE
jgi:hypothetical protein